MTKFGEVLRAFRQSSNDPERLNRRLTQERLGELIGHELGDMGYTGAAISDWELGKSKINAEDRKVLVALIKTFHRCGSLKTPGEAEELLKSGNYRGLNEEEAQKIFQDLPNVWNSEHPASEEKNPRQGGLFFLAEMLSLPRNELEIVLVKAREGPEPSWPRILAACMRKATDGFSLSFTSILWIAVWLLAFWLISPSLRLPFADHASVLLAMYMFVAGTLIIPLLIGVLVNTRDNDYWKEQNEVRPLLLRLYTYQGAGIGFNFGYFLVFPFSLMRYYLGFESAVWIEILAATAGLILGTMGARVVPHNLWRAYKRLALSDGGIFFLVALMGPLWGWFFVEYHSILLTPRWGIIVILLSLVCIVLVARWSSKKQAV